MRSKLQLLDESTAQRCCGYVFAGTVANLTMQHDIQRDTGGCDNDAVVIGLVNNTAPRAMRATERQFRDVLGLATGGRGFRLELYTLHDPRSAPGYQSLDALWRTRLDGLVVTGMDPRAATLPEEPGWSSLTGLVDWAEHNRVPAVWSCLAAHVAVLHLDNIARVRLPTKLSGLFGCELVAAAHPCADGLPKRFVIPHSRYNGLCEGQLRDSGYQVLTRSEAAGVDMFARDGRARFLFCQGHPEYGPDTLLREYLRDMRRYLNGQREAPADVPTHYLDSASECRLSAIRELALHRRDDALMVETQRVACDAVFVGGWEAVAIAVYANWLAPITANRRKLAA